MNSISIYHFRQADLFEAFEEAVDFRELKYSGSVLIRYGFSDATILQAVNRAVLVCKGFGLNPAKHFRSYYTVDMAQKQIKREWRMSKLGYYLALCNGSPGNPYVGAFQMEVIREMLSRLD